MLSDRVRNVLNTRRTKVHTYPYFKVYSGTGTAMGTTDFMTDYISDIRFSTSSSGGETIKVQGTKDGTNFVDLKPVNEATGNHVTSAALATGNYVLPLKEFGHFRQFKFVKSAGVQTGTVGVAFTRPKYTR